MYPCVTVSSQEKLTEDQGIEADVAEELAAEQREISVAEFFEKNKQMLGFDSAARAVVTAVKEGVDNSLDAAEEAEILPDIHVEIEDNGDTYTVVIEDNGPGIVKRQIDKIFGKLLYGSRFGKRVQSRGQQGIGISAAVLYSQLTSGKPARITSKTRSGEAHRFDVIIDTDTNEPEIVDEETVDWDRTHGTRIELEMEANMRARQQLHRYIKHTAVVNPHARVHLKEPKGEWSFERATDELPDETEEIKPHPHGVELGNLMRLMAASDSYSVKGFVQNEFTRVGGKTADSIEDGFRDRHLGREPSWNVPSGVEQEIRNAVANKGQQATAEFARLTRENMGGKATYSYVEDAVDDAAERVEEEFDKRFGDKVREDAVEAAWRHVTETRAETVLEHLEAATSDRKDPEALEELSERIAAKFDSDEDPRDRFTLKELRKAVRDSAASVEEVTEESFGDTAVENIVEELWTMMQTVDDDTPNVQDIAGDRNQSRALLEAMRAADVMAPPTDCLAPIGADLLEAGVRKEFDAEFYSAVTRDASVHGGDPFVVEAAIAYGGSLEAESPGDLLRFANRVPLVYQEGACAITQTVKDIGWKNYQLDDEGLPRGPVVLAVHLASTNVPFTSESKDAVANVPEIEKEVERAVRDVARDMKSHIKSAESRRKRREKERVISEVVPQIAEKIGEVTGRGTPPVEGSMAKILNKLYVDTEVDGDEVVLEAANYSNSNKSFELHCFVDSEPTLVDGDDLDVDVVDMDDEFDVVWRAEVSKGEKETLRYMGEEGMVSVDGVEDDLVEVRS